MHLFDLNLDISLLNSIFMNILIKSFNKHAHICVYSIIINSLNMQFNLLSVLFQCKTEISAGLFSIKI